MKPDELDYALRISRPSHSDVLPQLVVMTIEDTLATLPERSFMVRRERIRRFSSFSAAIVLFVVLLLAITAYAPDMKRQLAGLPGVGVLFGEIVKQQAVSVKDKGIKLIIKKVTYDGNIISMDYRVESSKAVDWQKALNTLTIKYNHFDYALYYANDVSLMNLSKAIESTQGTASGMASKDSRSFDGNLRLVIPVSHLTSFDLTLSSSLLAGQQGGWNLSVPAVQEQWEEKKVNQLVTNSFGFLQIDSIKQSSVSVWVKYTIKANYPIRNHQAGISVTDNRGRLIMGTNATAETGDGTAMLKVGLPDDSVKSLTSRFYYYDMDYIIKHENEEIKTLMKKQPSLCDPLILPAGEAGHIEVSDVKFLADRTEVTYRIVGSNPMLSFKVLSSKGNQMIPSNDQLLDNNNLNEHVSFFSALAEGDRQLTFVTKPNVALLYLPGLEATLSLSPSDTAK